MLVVLDELCMKLIMVTGIVHLTTSGKNHFHEMNGDVGMAGWK